MGSVPKTFDREKADRFLQAIAGGASAAVICEQPDMPKATQVRWWELRYPPFAQSYAEALDLRLQTWAEQLPEIADNAREDTIFHPVTQQPVVVTEHIARSKLRIDTRKWLLSTLKRDVYGDHVSVDNKHSGTVNVHLTADPELLKAVKELLE